MTSKNIDSYSMHYHECYKEGACQVGQHMTDRQMEKWSLCVRLLVLAT